MKHVLIAISLLMSAPAVHAAGNIEGLNPEFFISLISSLKKGRTIPETLDLVSRMSKSAFSKQIGFEAVRKEGYSIIGSNYTPKNSVVFKYVPKNSRSTRVMEADYKTREDAIEIGFLRVPSEVDQQEIKNMVITQGEAKIFGPNPESWSLSVAGGYISSMEYVAKAGKTSTTELRTSLQKLGILDNGVEPLPKLLKVEGRDQYATLSTLRINLENVSAQQVQSLIEEALELL